MDCLPQGLYPTKMIGNDFLKFVDNYFDLESEQLIRFMDDIYIFSGNSSSLNDDFQIIQRLLGDKGMSINPQKTNRDLSGHVNIEKGIDEIKKSLLKRRRQIIIEGYDEDDQMVRVVMLKTPLSKKELEYIDEMLKKPDIDEDDAELILTIMRDNAGKVESRLPYIISNYPNLSKSVHGFCAGVKDKEIVADAIIETSKSGRLTEFQLFWFAAILEDFLMETSKVPALISVLFNHKSVTSITRAKILEIQDLRFGLPELRNQFLMNGQSDWLAWSSAVGSRSLKPATRNHSLKYFGNVSEINGLISSILLKA